MQQRTLTKSEFNPLNERLSILSDSYAGVECVEEFRRTAGLFISLVFHMLDIGNTKTNATGPGLNVQQVAVTRATVNSWKMPPSPPPRCQLSSLINVVHEDIEFQTTAGVMWSRAHPTPESSQSCDESEDTNPLGEALSLRSLAEPRVTLRHFVY